MLRGSKDSIIFRKIKRYFNGNDVKNQKVWGRLFEVKNFKKTGSL